MGVFRFASWSIVVAALIVGCGSSSGTTTMMPVAISPSPLPTQTPSASLAGQAIALSPSGTSVTLASTNGLSGTIVLPGGIVAVGTTVTFLASARAPAALPQLQSVSRQTRAVGQNPFAYLQMQFSNAVSLDGAPGFTFGVTPSIDPTRGPVLLAFFDPQRLPPTWQLAVGAAAIITGATIRIAPTTTPVSFSATTIYVYALYQTQGPQPTPTSSASQSPVPLPSSTLPTGGVLTSPSPTALPT